MSRIRRVLGLLSSNGRVALHVAVGVLLITGPVALVTVEERPDAADLLAEAQAFVKDQQSFSFDADVRLEARESGDDSGGAGSSLVQRLAIEGSARLPGAARYTVDDGESLNEVVVVRPDRWDRGAEDAAALASTKWAKAEPAGDDGIVRPGGGASAGDPTDVGEPQDLLRLLDAVRAPAVVERPGRPRGTTVVRGRVGARDAFGALADDIDSAAVELAVGDGGRLASLVLDVRGPNLDLRATYRFSKWGDVAAIAAPDPAQIDPTPNIDEEGIAAFAEAPLLQPRQVPAGWSLVGASIIEADESVEDCRQVSVEFEGPDPETGYLYLYLVPAACPGLEGPPPGSRPFTAGRYRGFVATEEGGTTAQITVGRTVVQAETDLSPEDLAKVLANLVPLDLAKPSPATLSGMGGVAKDA